MSLKTNENGFLKLNVTVDPRNYRETLGEIAVKIKPNWSIDHLKYREYNGGLTNKLIGISSTNADGGCKGGDEKEIVLCRIYGDGTERFINRTDELNNMRLLYELKIGSKVYCQFNNGISYEYINGVISDYELLQDESVYSKVAQLIARYHKIKTPDESKSGFVKSSILFGKIEEIYNLVPDDYSLIDCPNKELIKRLPSKQAILNEVNALKDHVVEYLKMRSKINNIVFSHNDLLLGNIIYNKNKESDKQISFIDYEYSGYNYQAYDIANHFNEYAGTENVDYGRYPSKEYQIKWIRFYLNEYFNDAKSAAVTDDLIEDFYKQVNKFALLSQLFWSTWSIVQASVSDNIVFDYVSYAHIRFSEYFKRKNEFISL